MSHIESKKKTREVKITTLSGVWNFSVNDDLSESEIEKTKFLVKTWIMQRIEPNQKDLNQRKRALTRLLTASLKDKKIAAPESDQSPTAEIQN